LSTGPRRGTILQLAAFLDGKGSHTTSTRDTTTGDVLTAK
jgi:hypothetical protein